MKSKHASTYDRILLDILQDSINDTPLETLRRAYRAGQSAALVELASKAGSTQSKAKAAAARLNGKKGGRPEGSKNKHPRKKSSPDAK